MHMMSSTVVSTVFEDFFDSALSQAEYLIVRGRSVATQACIVFSCNLVKSDIIAVVDF